MSKRGADSPGRAHGNKRQNLARQSLRIQFRFARVPSSARAADETNNELSGRDAPREPISQTTTVWVDKDGMRNSMRAERFTDQRDMEDRAVLIQLEANNAALARDIKSEAILLNEPLSSPVIAPGMWGEDLFCGSEPGTGKLVEPSARTLCVGDVLAVRRRSRPRDSGLPVSPAVSALRMQISAPRRPGEKVDAAFGADGGGRGMRAYAARTGLGGLFCRVLTPGSLIDGDVLEVVERPQPRWTLERVSELLYGMEGVCDEGYALPGAQHGGAAAVKDKWRGTEEELRELASLSELAGAEWRDEFGAMLAALEGGWGCALM